MKKPVFSAVAALLFAACASAPQSGNKAETPRKQPDTLAVAAPAESPLLAAMERRKAALTTLGMTAAVNATMNGTAAPPANCTMTICGDDSLGMTFRAFGVPVGKLFARNDYFLFFDSFNNRALEGSPSAANIGRAINVPLSYADFAHLLRGEAPGDASRFAPALSGAGGGIQTPVVASLFHHKTPENGMEYALFSPEQKTLVQYQRKAPDGTIQLNVRYEDFTEQGGIFIARKVAISIPSQNSTVVFDASEITINAPQTRPLSFNVPSAVPRSRLE